MADGMKLASREAFEIRLGRDLIESEHKRVDAILEDTSAIALSLVKASWTPEMVPHDVAAVVLSAALRTFKNPDRYIQQAIGDYSARIDSSEFASGLFTKPELDILERSSGSDDFQFGSFGTIETVRDEVHSGGIQYWHTNRPGLPFPYSERVDW